MKDIFRFLYELIIGRPQPPMETPLYRNDIFPDVGGITLLLITMGMVILYYYLLNHFMRTAVFSHWYHWLAILLINAAIAFGYAVYYCRINEATPDSYIYWFAAANALYSAIFFLLFSMAVKWKSNNAAHTPF
ncbi:hypothetical protein [Nafulsella turpanensis]|uniref:hypothetical protein n=1 Tax=Nafulsella turpanensis TaxID=1265690 RepID=UPI00037E7740|nr:hypothetical protein [Nafulsella turpanensis]